MATLSMADVAAVASPSAARAPHWMYVVSHTDPRYGGLSAAVPSLAATLASQQGLDLSMAAFCLPNEAFRPAEMSDDHISFWPTSRVAWLRDRALQNHFAAVVREADGLHIHGLWEQSTATACRMARRLGKPYVLSAHGMLEPWALATKRLKKQIYAAILERANVANATCLHALTTAEADQYRHFGAKGPIAIVPNAVALPDNASPELFLTKFPELRGKRLLLFLSRLHPKKGLDLLLAAWEQTSKQHPETHLVIAGPDSDGMQAKLQAQATAAGITNSITFTGMLAGAMKWSALAAAEAYVLPSYSEGLSMALLEAMGMGLPVIATHACNMPQITAADAGWEVDANAAALASAVGDLWNRSAGENQSKGRNGAQLIAARYSPAQVARQMAEVYAFVLGGPAPESVVTQEGGSR